MKQPLPLHEACALAARQSKQQGFAFVTERPSGYVVVASPQPLDTVVRSYNNGRCTEVAA